MIISIDAVKAFGKVHAFMIKVIKRRTARNIPAHN